MTEIILNGCLLGLLLSTLIGPIFFLLIETSINRGARAAFFMDIGIILSDITFVIAIYYGISGILENQQVQRILYLTGGGIFILFGLFKLIRHKEKVVQPNYSPLSRITSIKLLFKGFLLNSVNPAIPIYWLGVVAFVVSTHADNKYAISTYFTAVLCTLFFTDMVKIYTARKLKKFLNPMLMLRINQVTGVILMGCGAALLLNLFHENPIVK